MPAVPKKVTRYIAKCDGCGKERPFEADAALSAVLCAASIDEWSWHVDEKRKEIVCHCRKCTIEKKL